MDVSQATIDRKNVADVRIILCSNKSEKTDKIRIPRSEINYLGDFNGEDLVKTTFAAFMYQKKKFKH